MDLASELREFLVTRRARITPQEAGIPVWDGERRVPGLRRSEVAALAGVSTDYYTKLERGVVTGVSANVAEAIANALRLDEAERLHWENLVVQLKAPPANNANGAPIDIAVRPGLQQVLVALAGTPAYLRTARRDILAANAMAEALFAPAFSRPARPVNIARFVFVDPAARSFFADWDGVAHAMAAALRLEVGRHPDDARLAGLIDSLLEQSERFRELWSVPDVGFHRTGTKSFQHPVVGRLDLGYEAAELPADRGLTLIMYTAPPGSPAEARLAQLAESASSHPER